MLHFNVESRCPLRRCLWTRASRVSVKPLVYTPKQYYKVTTGVKASKHDIHIHYTLEVKKFWKNFQNWAES